MSLLGLAVVVALAAVAGRWLYARATAAPALVEEREVRTVSSHAEIDDVVSALRCSCTKESGGARMRREGEGPAARGESLWRVVAACSRCDRRRALLFRVAS